jgi:hypothetical protein
VNKDEIFITSNSAQAARFAVASALDTARRLDAPPAMQRALVGALDCLHTAIEALPRADESAICDE